MKARRWHAAFSLIEVVIAIGVFASAVATMLLLLPNLTKQSRETANFLTAQQLPDALRIELKRIAAIEGFDQFANSLPEAVAPLNDGRAFVASRDGMRLHALDRPPTHGVVSLPEQYFLIECWKFTSEPLQPAQGKAHLVAYVRVSWPFRTGPSLNETVTTVLADRTQFTFTSAINR